MDHTDFSGLPIEARCERMPERARGHAIHFLNSGLPGLVLHRAAKIEGGYLGALPRWKQVTIGFRFLYFFGPPTHPLLELAKNFFSHPAGAVLCASGSTSALFGLSVSDSPPDSP